MLDQDVDPMKLPILNNAIPGTLPRLKKKNENTRTLLVLLLLAAIAFMIAYR